MIQSRIIFKYLFCFILLIFANHVFGFQQFNFNQNPNNSQTWALGGQIVTSLKQKFNNFTENPALLPTGPKKQLDLSLSPHFGNTLMSNLSYTSEVYKIPIGVFCKYLDYGSFDQTDLSGNNIGKFNASDFLIGFGLGKKKGNISFGTNLKLIGSNISTYNAFAAMIDFGVVFQHPTNEFQFGFTIKNIGKQFKTFIASNSSNIAIQINLGTSFKPQFMPIRFSTTISDIQNIISPELSPKTTSSRLVDHLSIGADLLVAKQLQLQIGYQGQNKALSANTNSSLSGLCLGLTINSSKINFGYSFANYHISGGVHCLTTSFQFVKK